MSGTGPRGREARREQPVKRVRNPEGGTDRGWNPGFVDLRAVVAVGAANLRKVAGAAQDSGGAFPVCLGGPSKSMGASRSAANGHGAGTADPWKTAQPSKRQGGSREAKIAATGVRDRAEGQTKPMKVGSSEETPAISRSGSECLEGTYRVRSTRLRPPTPSFREVNYG
jgi:hypothetical protein